MKKYKNIDTGFVFTLKEVREYFEMYKDEASTADDFDEYFETLLKWGREGVGGLVEIE